MPTITIGDYIREDNVIYQAILSNKRKPMLKEVLAYSSASEKWEEGSNLSFPLGLFKKAIAQAERITEVEFKAYQSNEQ